VGFGPELAGFGIKLTEPNGTGFTLRCEFAFEMRFGFGLDTPAGDFGVIEDDASDFFFLFVEVDERRIEHGYPWRQIGALCGGKIHTAGKASV
jgi:hypothetical protein